MKIVHNAERLNVGTTLYYINPMSGIVETNHLLVNPTLILITVY